jgi:hypothetical protein
MYRCSFSHHLIIAVKVLFIDTMAKHYSVRTLSSYEMMMRLKLGSPCNALWLS